MTCQYTGITPPVACGAGLRATMNSIRSWTIGSRSAVPHRAPLSMKASWLDHVRLPIVKGACALASEMQLAPTTKTTANTLQKRIHVPPADVAQCTLELVNSHAKDSGKYRYWPRP